MSNMDNSDIVMVLGIVLILFKLIDYYFKKQNDKAIQTYLDKELGKLKATIDNIQNIVYLNKELGTKIWDIHNKMDAEGMPVWYADRKMTNEMKEICVDILTTLNQVVGKISPKQDIIAGHIVDIKRVLDKLN